MGHILSTKGISPEPEKVDSIINMKPPSNTSELRSFLGLVTYCSKFIPDFATITEPLRRLTRQNVDFIWNTEQENAFTKIKTLISEAPVLTYFHPKSETKVITGANKQGLGAVLLQKNENGLFQPIAFASRSLTDVESRYSQTEREALAVVFSCERFKNYVYGLKFTIATDHKPLLKLYSPTCLLPPTRIHRWALRLQEFYFDLGYEPGFKNIADILSRKPYFDPPKRNEAEHFINYVVTNAIPKTVTFTEIQIH